MKETERQKIEKAKDQTKIDNKQKTRDAKKAGQPRFHFNVKLSESLFVHAQKKKPRPLLPPPLHRKEAPKPTRRRSARKKKKLTVKNISEADKPINYIFFQCNEYTSPYAQKPGPLVLKLS